MKLEFLLNEYTEITIINVNGKLYTKTVDFRGVEEYHEASSLHVALEKEDLLNPAPYPPATVHWQCMYETLDQDGQW